MPTLSTSELTKLSDTLARALSVDEVNQLGRDTGQAERLRIVTPHRLFLAVVSTLGSGHVESLADLLRAFNYHNEVDVAYKAFYNRLARVGFATFMRHMLARLIDQLRLQTLTPSGQQAITRFQDIVIHDGSSFALKPALAGAFPGRFTAIEPAAVEVHATFSGFADEVSRVQIAPDAHAERPFLPDPATLTDRLLLADRGYPSVDYFEAVTAYGGAFIVRLTRSYDPAVRAAWVDGRRVSVAARTRLSQMVARHAGHRVDLDVDFARGSRRVGFRVVVLPGREATMTRLCTNLPRTPFSADLIARLYRFRWQIELCFKEWKSYANLHEFATANPHIAEGLMWASLCAAVLKRFLAHAAQRVGGGIAMSTRRVAMCAHHILEALVTAVLAGVGLLAALRRGLGYLLRNARRSNVDRDQRTGRLRAGLGLVEVA
ncbi:MAG: IS4 family transposase [Acidobacteria bacterium]|nr:IS4 family transposase [Acidobacteriota bacterium]